MYNPTTVSQRNHTKILAYTSMSQRPSTSTPCRSCVKEFYVRCELFLTALVKCGTSDLFPFTKSICTLSAFRTLETFDNRQPCRLNPFWLDHLLWAKQKDLHAKQRVVCGETVQIKASCFFLVLVRVLEQEAGPSPLSLLREKLHCCFKGLFLQKKVQQPVFTKAFYICIEPVAKWSLLKLFYTVPDNSSVYRVMVMIILLS